MGVSECLLTLANLVELETVLWSMEACSEFGYIVEWVDGHILFNDFSSSFSLLAEGDSCESKLSQKYKGHCVLFYWHSELMATPWSLSICVRLRIFENCRQHAGKHLSVRKHSLHFSLWAGESLETRLIPQGSVLAHRHYWNDLRGKEVNNSMFIS